MYRTLLPVDTNANRAMSQARYVARLAAGGADVGATVLYVVPPDEFTTADEVEFGDVDAAVRAADFLESEGVPVTRTVDDGGVSEEIARTAGDVDADEVVMGGRKRSGVAKALLGSTVLDVMLSAERPVTITGENTVYREEGPRRVLLAVDGSEERARHQAEYVAGLPGAPGDIEATVLYVFPHQDYAGAPPHEFEEIDAAVQAADTLEDEGIAVERVGVGGEVARTILDAAEERGVDSIVMGGRKRSGLQRELLGSITQDVMLSAERPVTLTG